MVWSLDDVKRFYATVGQRTQDSKYKSEKIEEYHELEEEFLRKEIPRASSVLEVGCGKGRILDLLKDRCIELVGVEYIPEVAEETAKRFEDWPNVEVIYGDILEMDGILPENHFDYVLCMFNTLGTIPKPYDEKAVDLFKKWVRPGGKIILSVYSEDALEEQLILYDKAGWNILAFDEEAVYTKEGLVSRRYTEDKLRDYFKLYDDFDVDVMKLNDISYILVAKKRGMR